MHTCAHTIFVKWGQKNMSTALGAILVWTGSGVIKACLCKLSSGNHTWPRLPSGQIQPEYLQYIPFHFSERHELLRIKCDLDSHELSLK